MDWMNISPGDTSDPQGNGCRPSNPIVRWLSISRSRVMARGVLIACSALLTLALLEIGLRIFAHEYSAFTQPDDIIGYSLVPGAYYEVSALEDCPGWTSAGRINSHGLRDREYPYAKPPGVFRILALGDSYTEFLPIELDRVWPKLLEDRLNSREDNLLYEVINAGRSGMGTATEYLYYLNEGRKYNPDLVLVLFIPNDFTDNSRELGGNRYSPYFFLKEGKLVLDTSFTDRLTYKLKKVINPLKQISYLVSFMTQVYNRIDARMLTNDIDNVFGSANLAAMQVAEFLPAEIAAVEVTERLFVEMNKSIVYDDRARFAIIIGSYSSQVNWIATSEWSEWSANTFLPDTDQLMEDFAEREDLHHLNLVPILRKYSSEHQEIIHGCDENGGSGHWNELGHTIAANEVYDFLIRSSLVP